MSDNAFAAIIVGGSFAIIMAIIVFYVLLVIAYWKIFKKMGVPGWKSIVPFYNMYVQIQKTWKTSYFWLIMALVIIGSAVTGYGQSADSSMVSLVGSCMTLVGYILAAVSFYYLGKAFGKGIGFFILSLFLPNIALLYLGFSSARYQGNPTYLTQA